MNKIVHSKDTLAAISIIPESAPFDSQQRAWLNGFFAGMTGIEELMTSHVASEPGVGDDPIEVAEEEDFPWHDDSLSIDERMELAEGKPIERKLMAAMAQLDCGSCGYLCQTYSEAIACGDETNLTLCSPGGKETARLIKKLVKLEGAPARSESSHAPRKTAEPKYSRNRPLTVQLIRSTKLTGPASAKDVRHVEIDLSSGQLNYDVGDALGLYPTNCGELVDQILAHCEPTNRFAAKESLMSRDVAQVTDELCDLIGRAITQNDDRERFDRLIENEDELDELDVLDFLQLFESEQVCALQLIESLRALSPRLYSIASSPKRHPGQVHLTVGKVTYTKGERLRKGVASTLLADRVEPGSKLKVFVHKAHGFTVPADDSAPMIMVGPGTGIAPFIAFLQEREARQAGGKNWLFFGDQYSETDFLYRDELSLYLGSGLLTRLDTAFSRDQDYKIYVQDRMREHAAELFDWLEAGASFFVCGDARQMAKDVDAMLLEIIKQHGRLSDDESISYVKDLKDSGRYLRDVY